jgi:hypothetical protein
MVSLSACVLDTPMLQTLDIWDCSQNILKNIKSYKELKYINMTFFEKYPKKLRFNFPLLHTLRIVWAVTAIKDSIIINCPQLVEFYSSSDDFRHFELNRFQLEKNFLLIF